MNSNIEYVTKVGWYILGHKKLTSAQYINYMALPTTPLDEIGLVLFARMKKIHISFLMSEKFWTTQQNHEIKKCTIILAFQGSLTFNDTKVKIEAPKSVPVPLPEKKDQQDQHYSLSQWGDNKDKSSPQPEHSRANAPPPRSPQAGKVVIRMHGIPKKTRLK